MDSETKKEAKAREAEAEAVQAVDEGIDTITAEVSRLRSELAHALESVGRIGRERVNAITHNETVTHGIAAGEAAVDSVSKELRALEHDIAESTRRYPWRALGIAACLGFVIGLVVRR